MKAFIDTNVFIYALEEHPRFGEQSSLILGRVDSGEVEGVVSTLVLMEVCWFLEAGNRVEAMEYAINQIINSRLLIVDVTGSDVLDAVRLRREYVAIDLNDLINYRVMMRLGLKNIFSNDAHFRRLPGVEPRFEGL
ncbi:MAG: type II toxin-antitoxin system VapC family toxin [Candidatus Bathyarchaeota archaeon]|nr:type II toxin-antitoxin system VapC family toxin [Candidatus Bathyarchaeota archaeon]